MELKMGDYKKLALLNRHFHSWFASYIGVLKSGDDESVSAGASFAEMSLDRCAAEFADLDSSHMLHMVVYGEIKKAIESNDESRLVNIASFRNDYLRLYPDEIGHIRAAIDEHLPRSFLCLLDPQ